MYEPELTAVVVPSPQVRVDFNTVDPGAVRATVFKDSGSGTVRDGILAFAAGGFTVTDYEIPTDVSVSYWAEMFDASGASLGVTGKSQTIVYGELGYAWVSDPMVPGNAVQVALGDTFGESLAVTRQMAGYQVSGKTVFLMGQLSLLQDIDLTMKTDTLEQADKLQEILRASFVLVRTTARLRIPACLYVAVSTVPERNVEGLDAVQFGGERLDWPVVGQEMSPTDVGVAIPVVSWQTYIDAFPTWQDMIDAYPTWLDAMKNPPVV